MHQPSFLDPLGSRLPALEQNLLKLRSAQMVLVLFYAEQLKSKVLTLIQNTDGFFARTGSLCDNIFQIAEGGGAQGRVRSLVSAAAMWFARRQLSEGDLCLI